MVVVKWLAWSPSTPKIRVRIPPSLQLLFYKNVWKVQNERKRGPEMAHLLKKLLIIVSKETILVPESWCERRRRSWRGQRWRTWWCWPRSNSSKEESKASLVFWLRSADRCSRPSSTRRTSNRDRFQAKMINAKRFDSILSFFQSTANGKGGP